MFFTFDDKSYFTLDIENMSYCFIHDGRRIEVKLKNDENTKILIYENYEEMIEDFKKFKKFTNSYNELKFR